MIPVGSLKLSDQGHPDPVIVAKLCNPSHIICILSSSNRVALSLALLRLAVALFI